jgi:hypothetical protein
MMVFSLSYGKPKSMCRCGHTGDGFGGSHGGFDGHGACLAGNCRCRKFTWVRWTKPFQKLLATITRRKIKAVV